MLPARAATVASGPYEPPSFTVPMVEGVRPTIEEAARHDVAFAIMPGVAELYDAAIARGESGARPSRGLPVSRKGVGLSSGMQAFALQALVIRSPRSGRLDGRFRGRRRTPPAAPLLRTRRVSILREPHVP